MATKNGKQRKASNSVRCWLDYNQVDRPLPYFELPEDADNRQKKIVLLMRQTLYMALMAHANPDGTGITVGLDRLSHQISRRPRMTKIYYADLKRLGLATDHGREPGRYGRGVTIRHVHPLSTSLLARQIARWGGEVRLIGQADEVLGSGTFVPETNVGLGSWGEWISEVQSSPYPEVQSSHAEVQGSHTEVQPSQGRGSYRLYRLNRKEKEGVSSSTYTHTPNQLAARSEYKKVIKRLEYALGETPMPPGSDALATAFAGFLDRDGWQVASEVMLFWYVKNQDYVSKNPKKNFNLGTITNQYEAYLTAMKAQNWSLEKMLAEPVQGAR